MSVKTAITNAACVTACVLATIAATSCSSDADVPEPGSTTVAPLAPAATTSSPTNSVVSTGLTRIDGPATVDSSFSGANPGDDGG
jgi:hypothetical protein